MTKRNYDSKLPWALLKIQVDPYSCTQGILWPNLIQETAAVNTGSCSDVARINRCTECWKCFSKLAGM